MEAYMEDARERAEAALDRLRPMLARPRPLLQPTDFGDLFHDAAGVPLTPRPMQAAVAAATKHLPPGSVLILIENAIGSGKTEAADLAVQRLVAAGKASGAYFALPTTATADAAYRRREAFWSKLLPDPDRDVVLAHSRSRRSGLAKVYKDRDEARDDAGALAWYASSSRQALLAQAGVGTVDQALLGAVRARFNTVRLLGLWDKVLVIDERRWPTSSKPPGAATAFGCATPSPTRCGPGSA